MDHKLGVTGSMHSMINWMHEYFALYTILCMQFKHRKQLSDQTGHVHAAVFDVLFLFFLKHTFSGLQTRAGDR